MYIGGRLRKHHGMQSEMQGAVAPQGDRFTELLDRHLNSIRRRDIEAFGATVGRDVRLVGTNGAIVEGWDAAVSAHREWFEDPSWQFEPQILFAKRRDGAGWALARVHYSTGRETTTFNLFLLFERDAAGMWKLVYDQGTSIPDTVAE
jgi:hypothetical protein